MGAQKQIRMDVVGKIEAGKMHRRQAEQVLDVSQRTLERYIGSFRKKGVTFILHGNSGRKPANKTDEKLKQRVITLVREKYHDFNMSHCLEKLRADEKIEIKRETFRRWCHEIRHVKRAKRRTAKARYRRQRMQSTGLLLQMDGSPHKWFGGKEATLITAIDDADSDIAYGEFFPAEDTLSCMTVLQRIIEIKGLFGILYVDRAGLFGGQKRTQFSQVKRALLELGIHTIYAQSAEAKGRIERTFQTLQDRTIPEMRLKGIKTYPAANKYLLEYFATEWKDRFTVKPRNCQTAYRPLSTSIELKEIFCLKHHRTVKRDHTVTYDSKLYSLRSPTKFSIYKQQIEFRTYQDLSLKAFYAGKEIELTLVETIDNGLSVWQSMKKTG